MKVLSNFIPRLAWQLASGNPLRFLWLLLRLYYFVGTRQLFSSLRKRSFPIQGRYKKLTFTFYLEIPWDVVVLFEVFVFKEYEWELKNKPELIVDLGAHLGDTALYYHAVYPEATIIAVEPEPHNYDRLVRHVQHIKEIIPVHAAVGAADGTLDLHLSDSSLGHSLVARSENDQTVAVTQYSLATLRERYNLGSIDLLKFDIEGAEFALFDSLDIAKAARAYIGELHYSLDQTASIEKTKDTFSTFGQCELVKQPQTTSRYLLRAQ